MTTGSAPLALDYKSERGLKSIANRKTTTSTEVKSRWMRENYKTYRVNLRYDTDQEIINYMEQRKDLEGVTPIIREALENYIKKDGHS